MGFHGFSENHGFYSFLCKRKKPKLNLFLEKDFENGIDCILFLV